MSSEARKVVTGLGWVSAANYTNRLLGFVTTLILARLLAPEQFGLVAIAAMMVDVLKIFRDLGLGQALIYRRDDSPLAYDTALAMIVPLNILLIAIAAAISPLVSAFFANPSITPVLIVMSANLLPIGIRAVPEALLRRGVDFKKLAIPEVISAAVASVVGIAMALLDFGVWALVARTLTASILGALLIWGYVQYRPRLRFDRQIGRELFGYGRFVVGATLLSVALYNVDKLYIGKLAGVTALGLYSMAGMLANMPVTEFGHLLCRVIFPVLCDLNQDQQRLRETFLTAFRYNALAVVPLGIVLAMFGDEIATIAFGAKWHGAGPLLRVLALAALLRAISSVSHELLRATGNVQAVQRFIFARLIVLAVLGIPVLKFGGLIGVCSLIAITNFVVLGAELHRIASVLGCRSLEIVRQAVQPLVIAVLSIGLVYVAHSSWFPAISVWSVAAALLLSAVLYVAAVLLYDRRVLSEARTLLAGRS